MQIQKKLVKGKSISEISEELEERGRCYCRDNLRDGRKRRQQARRTIENAYLGLVEK